MTATSIFAPAKLNLFLAITGRRADGFHDLLSVVVQLNFGDTVTVTPGDGLSLRTSDATLSSEPDNLVLKAARAFASASQWHGGAHFVLEKRIPLGAGLGGGSSDAVATLRALNQWVEAPYRLAPATLATLAATLGSDCPLFLHDGPVILRGRGERVSPLEPEAAKRIRGRRVLVFKPGFGVATPWAYAQLAAAAPASYLPGDRAEARLREWLEDPARPAEALLFNNMEPPAFEKFVALPVLLQQLAQRFGLAARMSGSGSACFAFIRDDTDVEAVIRAIREAWGESAFVIGATVT